MMNKFLIYSLSLVLLFCACGTDGQNPGENTDKNRPLKVAISQNTPGYFIVGGESYGYSYELLNAYAASAGREMHIEADIPVGSMNKYLKKHKADIIVSLSTNADGSEMVSVPLYSTNYVVLASGGIKTGGKRKASITDLMQKSTIMVSSGFQSTDSYNKLLDSLPSARIYISPREGFDMARSLSGGDFDMLICEKSEALLAMNILRNVKRIYEFDEQVSVSLVFDGRNGELPEDFNLWLANYRETKDFASLGAIYFKKGVGKQSPSMSKYNRVVGGISVWDDVIREVGRSEGVDWRLLSAIAYNESRFEPEAISHRGARGLMQIMPIVARQFKMEGRDLHDPRTSLIIASKLIKSIDNMIGFSDGTTEDDRLSIILAAYNGGIGNIQSARRLASAHDEHPDSWEAVSKYLVLMGDSSFEPKGIEYRRFRGSGETLAFVDNVLERYDTYRRMVQ